MLLPSSGMYASSCPREMCLVLKEGTCQAEGVSDLFENHFQVPDHPLAPGNGPPTHPVHLQEGKQAKEEDKKQKKSKRGRVGMSSHL